MSQRNMSKKFIFAYHVAKKNFTLKPQNDHEKNCMEKTLWCGQVYKWCWRKNNKKYAIYKPIAWWIE